MTNATHLPDVQPADSTAETVADSWILRFLDGAWRFRWTAIGLFTLSVAAAAAFAVLSTEIYRGEVLMMPKRDGGKPGLSALAAAGLGGLTSQLGLGGGSSGDTSREALATLKSRAFITMFIEEQDLLPALFHDRWDASAERWHVEDREIPSLADGYRRFMDIMSVSEDLQTGLVELKVDWHDYQVVAVWSNALVTRLNRLMRDRATLESTRSIEFLNQQFTENKIVEIRAAIASLIEANMQTIMMASVHEQYAFKVIDPAVEPEPDQFIRPKRLLLLAVGIVFGGFLAATGVLLRLSFEPLSRPPSSHRDRSAANGTP